MVEQATNLQNVDPHEEALFSAFINKNALQRRTLADMIQEQLDRRHDDTDAVSVTSAGGNNPRIRPIDPRVAEMFGTVREILSRYRSGKLPKVFKIIPKLANWEQVGRLE